MSRVGVHADSVVTKDGSFRSEIAALLKLAIPVVCAELGWMAMGVVDTLMVGRLGALAIGAVGLANIAFFTITVFGMGLLLGLDTLVSQAVGAGRRDEARIWLRHGIVLGVVVSIPSMALVEVACSRALPAVGVRPEVIELVLPYVRTENFSLPFLLVFVAVRRYLQSVGGERAVMFALITANAVNVLGNWLLIDGNLGFPRLETVGSALATVGARIYMAAVVIVAVVLREGTDAFHGLRRWESARLRRLLSLGLPAAIHTTLEVGIFSLMTAVAGRFPTGDLAGHQVAITIIGTVFMIPLGISSAAAVRVGHAVGRRDPRGIRSAGWATLLTTAVAMTCASLLFAALSNSLVRMFTDEPSVIAAAVGLLWLAVAFQLFDGAQVATTGLLRGAGNTKAPMAYNLLAHWAIGLPVGLWLGVGRNWSVYGLWIGLYAGLVAASFALVATWYRLMRRIRRDPGAIDQIANSSQAVMDLGSPQEDPVAEPMRRAPAGV